jgi:hypothetical protein
VVGLVSGCGGGPNRAKAIAANEAILSALPRYPGATFLQEISGPVRGGVDASSPILGYGTTDRYRLPTGSTCRTAASWYRRMLTTRRWTLSGFSGDLESGATYRRGHGTLFVNCLTNRVNSETVHVLNVIVNAAGLRH